MTLTIAKRVNSTMPKNAFDLTIDFLLNPEKTLTKTQEENLKFIDALLKPRSVKIYKF